MPADVEGESEQAGGDGGEAEPHEEDTGRRHLEHEQDRGQDHPVPGPEREQCIHGVESFQGL